MRGNFLVQLKALPFTEFNVLRENMLLQQINEGRPKKTGWTVLQQEKDYRMMECETIVPRDRARSFWGGSNRIC